MFLLINYKVKLTGTPQVTTIRSCVSLSPGRARDLLYVISLSLLACPDVFAIYRVHHGREVWCCVGGFSGVVLARIGSAVADPALLGLISAAAAPAAVAPVSPLPDNVGDRDARE